MGRGRGRGQPTRAGAITRRRRSAALGVAVLVLALLPAVARAGEGARTVFGRVSVVSPVHPAVSEARCAWLTHGRSAQGMLGYMVELAPMEASVAHEFDLVARVEQTMAITEKVVVVFYEQLGTCAGGEKVVGAHRGTADGVWLPHRSRFALVVPYSEAIPSFDICYGGTIVCHVGPANPNTLPLPHVFRFTVRSL